MCVGGNRRRDYGCGGGVSVGEKSGDGGSRGVLGRRTRGRHVGGKRGALGKARGWHMGCRGCAFGM